LIPIYSQLMLDVDITNACTHRCSNCTRLVGHHRKPYFMSFDDFKRAVASLKNYPKMVSIMGGEPLLHPMFADITNYLADNIGGPRLNNGVKPITDIIAYRNAYLSQTAGKKRGLFTSMGSRFRDYLELIFETYEFIGLNDHQHDGEHQAILIASKELPISEEVRRKNIEHCWINAKWSACINQAGAFFCECCASMDLLFNQGKLAWKVEPNWWTREPHEWKEQMYWCDFCGAAQNTPSRRANDGIDDISPENLKMLRRVRSPKVQKGAYRVFPASQYDATKMAARPMEPYLPDGNNRLRMAPTNKSVFPKKLEAVVVCVGFADFLDLTLPWNMKHFDKYVVVTSSEDKDTQEVAKKYGATIVISDRYKENGAKFNKGKLVNDAMKVLDYDDWVLFTDVDILLPTNLREEFNKRIWNPGILYYASRLHTPPFGVYEWVTEYQKNEALAKTLKFCDPNTNQKPWGYFQLFNCRAQVLKGKGRNVCSEDFTSAGGIDKHFEELWPPSRQALAPFSIIHMAHGPMGGNWTGRKSPPLHFQPTNPIKSDEWFNIAWLDEKGYNITYPQNAPGYIKFVRVDTGEFVIAPNTRPPRGGFIQHGGFKFHAHHSGIVVGGFAVPTDRQSKGKVIIYTNNNRLEYTGWGMGHVMYEDNRQGYVWAGEPIAPTKFDVFWKARLAPEEHKFLMVGT